MIYFQLDVWSIQVICDKYLLNPHPWALINHHHPLLIRLVHDFLSVRIVRGPDTVRTKPSQQVKVLGYQREVQPFTSDVCVLMLGHSMAVEWFIVQK